MRASHNVCVFVLDVHVHCGSHFLFVMNIHIKCNYCSCPRLPTSFCSMHVKSHAFVASSFHIKSLSSVKRDDYVRLSTFTILKEFNGKSFSHPPPHSLPYVFKFQQKWTWNAVCSCMMSSVELLFCNNSIQFQLLSHFGRLRVVSIYLRLSSIRRMHSYTLYSHRLYWCDNNIGNSQ